MNRKEYSLLVEGWKKYLLEDESGSELSQEWYTDKDFQDFKCHVDDEWSDRTGKLTSIFHNYYSKYYNNPKISFNDLNALGYTDGDISDACNENDNSYWVFCNNDDRCVQLSDPSNT